MKTIKITNIFVPLLSIIFLITATILNSKTNQNVKIISINTVSNIVDDWKTPGRYAPFNVFDDDPSTCFAAGGDLKSPDGEVFLDLDINFEKVIDIDEIRILNGFSRDKKTYYENSRTKKLFLGFSPTSTENKNDTITNLYVLEDKMDFQSIKLLQSYKVKSIFMLACNVKDHHYYEIYPGSKYSDLCVSEISFYHKGEKINVENIDLLKKNYKQNLNTRLVNFLSDKVFSYGGSDMNSLTSYKDGRLKFLSKDGNTPANAPVAWKVEDAKLYLRKKDEWILFEYMFYQNTSIKIIDPNYWKKPGSHGILYIWDYYGELK